LSETTTKNIQRVGWSLLCEWWCVPVDATTAEVIAAIREHTELPVPSYLIEDRLYGGFACENPEKRHVLLNTGQYTYLHPENNMPLDAAAREGCWHEVMAKSAARGRFIGGGPFTDDAPKTED